VTNRGENNDNLLPISLLKHGFLIMLGLFAANFWQSLEITNEFWASDARSAIAYWSQQGQFVLCALGRQKDGKK